MLKLALVLLNTLITFESECQCNNIFTINHIGVGCVIRDYCGDFVVTRSYILKGRDDAFEAKLVGMSEVLNWLKERALTDIIIKLDS